MSPEAKEHFDKAHQYLAGALTILAVGVGEDARRNAYLAAFPAAQALMAERRAKTPDLQGRARPFCQTDEK